MSEERKFNKTHIVFSIYDTKAESFSPPFTHITTGLGLRFLETLCNEAHTTVAKFPEDHTLFRIGEWDERKGEMRMDLAPVALARAIDYTIKEEKETK